ncbi:hypothetical protein SOM12_04045 [Flavobacterium sp. CFBP9031]|uniref:hypothetical protein n=1 Tax=Flavobacterium sp. CFBP9031 TaxID=3096538 RepID=UPI002A6B1F3C|nr:hypothetical protein [Flavobacterium sp. CFBP9031]MDY0986573.1 hypothetical protein [Flavobacterium sp. CFBP9031]
MKIYVLSIFYFFFVSKIFSQKKDTLYFDIDKYYTISPTINQNLENESSRKRGTILRQAVGDFGVFGLFGRRV